MASGDTLLTLTASNGISPAATAAAFGVRAGGSTPAESVPVISFDAATDEFIDFYGIMPQSYAGTTGLTLKLFWSAASATSNDCIWSAAFRSMEDDAEDIDTSHSYAFNSVTDTAPSASGEVTVSSITFTDGADADSVGAGDQFILRVSRDADNGSDTMAGDAELWSVEIRET